MIPRARMRRGHRCGVGRGSRRENRTAPARRPRPLLRRPLRTRHQRLDARAVFRSQPRPRARVHRSGAQRARRAAAAVRGAAAERRGRVPPRRAARSAAAAAGGHRRRRAARGRVPDARAAEPHRSLRRLRRRRCGWQGDASREPGDARRARPRRAGAGLGGVADDRSSSWSRSAPTRPSRRTATGARCWACRASARRRRWRRSRATSCSRCRGAAKRRWRGARSLAAGGALHDALSALDGVRADRSAEARRRSPPRRSASVELTSRAADARESPSREVLRSAATSGSRRADRCRNCGYDFSLSPAVALPDLPIRRDADSVEGLDDLALIDAGTARRASSGFDAEFGRAPEPRAARARRSRRARRRRNCRCSDRRSKTTRRSSPGLRRPVRRSRSAARRRRCRGCGLSDRAPADRISRSIWGRRRAAPRVAPSERAKAVDWSSADDGARMPAPCGESARWRSMA